MAILKGNTFFAAPGRIVMERGRAGLLTKPLLAPSGGYMLGTVGTATMASIGGVVDLSPLFFFARLPAC